MNDSCICALCRSGTDEQFAEKKKLLQDISDLRQDADEHKRVLALSKCAEMEAKKKAADLRLVAMRASKAGDQKHLQKCLWWLGSIKVQDVLTIVY